MGGRPKSFLELEGARLIDRQLRVLTASFDECFLVTHDPASYEGLGLRVIEDVIPGQPGPLAGILTALTAARADHVLCVACDMPRLVPALLELVCTHAPDADIVVPVVAGRPEPLCARYARGVAATARKLLEAGERAAVALLSHAHTVELDEARLRAVDPALESFANLNSPDDLERIP
jgi:molybdopterin-guanine dinucleotide biosynthesis protein A